MEPFDRVEQMDPSRWTHVNASLFDKNMVYRRGENIGMIPTDLCLVLVILWPSLLMRKILKTYFL